MHTHMSLFEGDTNAFFEAGAQYQLSKIGRQFIAGLLRHAPEITAVTNQFVNSYKRLWGGDEAPSFVCWGHNNRSALVRVPLYKPNKGQSVARRVPRDRLGRQPLPRVLADAGGRSQGHRGGATSCLRRPRTTSGRCPTPSAGRSATTSCRPASTTRSPLMEESELVAETLGEQVFNYVLLNKRREWAEYRAQVTPFELRTNLEIL